MALVPLDIITPIHNAFRKGLTDIDDAVYNIAKNGGDLSPVLAQLTEYNKYLEYHAGGEEDAVFPAVEKIAPQVAKAFDMDHRELDVMSEATEKVLNAKNELDAARGTASYWTHLRVHLAKEDAFLYPLLRAGISEAEQGPIVGIMASKTPHDQMPGLIAWVTRNTTRDERETVNRIWKSLMPEQVYSNVKGVVKDSMTADDWADLTKRVPELA